MIKRLTLSADEGKILTNGKERLYMVYLFESEIAKADEWTEVDEENV